MICPGLQMRLNWIWTKSVRRPYQVIVYNYISKTIKCQTHLGSLRKSGTERSVVLEKGLTVKGVWETKHAQGQAYTLERSVSSYTVGISRTHASAIFLTFEGSWEQTCLWIRRATKLWSLGCFTGGQPLMKCNTKRQSATSHWKVGGADDECLVQRTSSWLQQLPVNHHWGAWPREILLGSSFSHWRQQCPTNSLICGGRFADKELEKLERKNSEKRRPPVSQIKEDPIDLNIWSINIYCLHWFMKAYEA